MIILESRSEQKCIEVTTAAYTQIKNIEIEKENLNSILYAAQADIAITNQFKLQVIKQFLLLYLFLPSISC